MNDTLDTTELVELDERASEGIGVRLLWHPGSADVLVEVFDSCADEQFSLKVPGSQALDAFHHPFAYAARTDALLPEPLESAEAPAF